MRGKALGASCVLVVICFALDWQSPSTLAHGYKRKAIEVVHPYTFATPEPGGRDAIVRMTLRNSSKQLERLKSAASVIAERVEIVVPKAAAGNGNNPVRPRLEIKPGGEVELSETVSHLRLVGLKRPLVAYDTLPVTLTFDKAGRLDIDVLVEEMAAVTDPQKQ